MFAYNLQEIEQEADAIAKDAFQYRESDPAESRRILEEGLTRYPENEILLNNLLYTLNYREKPDETIRLASHLIDRATSSDVKYDALRFLAYAYSAKGDTDAAIGALEQIPEIYFTKLSEMAFILSGEPKYEAAKKQKRISFETMIQMMWKLAECLEANGNTTDALAETEKALSLIQIFTAGEDPAYWKTYVRFFQNQLEEMRRRLM